MRLTSNDKSPRPAIYAVAVLLALGVIFKILSAAPTWMHYDENYYLNIAQNYIERGELTPYMWRLDEGTNIIAGSGSGYGILLLTNWLRLTGVTLVNGRLLMIGVGIVTAGVMAAVARKWWGSRAAGIAALIFAIASTSPFYSFVVRMDSFGMLMYSLVLLLHIYAVRDGKRWLHFMTGVLVVLSAEFHILGILYTVALTLYYLIVYVREVVQRRRIVLNTGPVYFAVGGFITGLIYVAIHILPDPQAYFSISSQCFQCEGKELMRIARFMLLRPIEFVLIFVTVITAVLRRQPEDQHFLILFGGWLLAEAVIGIPPFTHYSYHMWPLLAIGTAGLFTRGALPHGVLSRSRTMIGLGLAALTLLFNFGLHLANLHPTEMRFTTESPETIVYVRRVVPKDTVVMTHPKWFYSLQDYHNFLSYRDGEIYGITKRGESQLDFWRRIQPLVVVGGYSAEDPELAEYMDEMQFEEIMPDLWVVPQFASPPV